MPIVTTKLAKINPKSGFRVVNHLGLSSFKETMNSILFCKPNYMKKVYNLIEVEILRLDQKWNQNR
jgi:hypothetical protein